MKRHGLLGRGLASVCIAIVLMSASTTAAAEDSCTCSKQTDGTTFCTCVDDKGRTYCKSCPADGGPCTVVPCS